MDMVVLSLIVVGCSIVVFFSQEFGNAFKKLFAIRGMKLLLPLILTTALIVYYEHWVLWGLLHFQTILQGCVTLFAGWLPFQTGASSVAKVLILFVSSILPVFALHVWLKKKTYQSFKHAYVTSTMIWLLVGILLIVSYQATIAYVENLLQPAAKVVTGLTQNSTFEATFA